MLDTNEVYVIETDGSIHEMNFVGDSDWDIEPTTSLQEIRNKTIDEAMLKVAKTICIGCGYLDGVKCTYKGSNCGVSKPMLESVIEALEQMKDSNDLEGVSVDYENKRNG